MKPLFPCVSTSTQARNYFLQMTVCVRCRTVPPGSALPKLPASYPCPSLAEESFKQASPSRNRRYHPCRRGRRRCCPRGPRCPLTRRRASRRLEPLDLRKCFARRVLEIINLLSHLACRVVFVVALVCGNLLEQRLDALTVAFLLKEGQVELLLVADLDVELVEFCDAESVLHILLVS